MREFDQLLTISKSRMQIGMFSFLFFFFFKEGEGDRNSFFVRAVPIDQIQYFSLHEGNGFIVP